MQLIDFSITGHLPTGDPSVDGLRRPIQSSVASREHLALSEVDAASVSASSAHLYPTPSPPFICIPPPPPLSLEHITPPPTLPAIRNNKAACGGQK